MRLQHLLVFPLSLLAVPLAAQAGVSPFEGTVKMRVGAASPAMVINWSIKGQLALGSMTYDSPQTGPMDITFVQDNAAQKSTFMMPIPDQFAPILQQLSPGATGIKIVSDSKAGTAPTRAGAPAVAPKKLGTKQTIAGMPCDDYEIQDSSKTRFCANTSLGRFVYPDLNGGMNAGRGAAGGARRGGGGAGGMFGNITVPDWVGGLSGSGFPLKVWASDGEVLMEVTAVEKKSISADIFTIPSSYVDMNAMLGGFGGRGGGGGGR